jgi:hypothetical protein
MRDSKKRPREHTGNGMVRPHIGERCWDGASVERSTAMSNKSIARLAARADLLSVRVQANAHRLTNQAGAVLHPQ